MTRAERAAEKVRKEKEQRAKQQRRAQAHDDKRRAAIAKAEAILREEDRKTRNKRRFQVGAVAEEAGLFALDQATLVNLFTLLTSLTDLPNPVAVLDALLTDAGLRTTEEQPPRVPAACAVVHGHDFAQVG